MSQSLRGIYTLVILQPNLLLLRPHAHSLSSCRSHVCPNRPRWSIPVSYTPPLFDACPAEPISRLWSPFLHLHPSQTSRIAIGSVTLPLSVIHLSFLHLSSTGPDYDICLCSSPPFLAAIIHGIVGETPSYASSTLPPPVRVVPPLVISIINAVPSTLPIRSQGVHRTIAASPSTPH